MIYFKTAAQRRAQGGTLYFEFQPGSFRQKHWLADSIYLYADDFDQLGLNRLFFNALPHFDYYYVTEVTPEQFLRLRSAATELGGTIAAVLDELTPYAMQWLETHGVFTICGI